MRSEDEVSDETKSGDLHLIQSYPDDDDDDDDYDDYDDDDDVDDDDDDDDDNESASSRLPRVIRLRSIAMRRTIVHQTLKYLSLP